MARNITLTLGPGLGDGLGPNFNLTANVGSVTPSTATKTDLLAGKSVSVVDEAAQVTVTSTGTCTNSITQSIPCAEVIIYLNATTYEVSNGPNNTEIYLQVGDGSVVFTTDVTFDYNISLTPSGTNSGTKTLPAGFFQVFVANYDPSLESVSSITINNFDPSPVDGYIINTIG